MDNGPAVLSRGEGGSPNTEDPPWGVAGGPPIPWGVGTRSFLRIPGTPFTVGGFLENRSCYCGSWGGKQARGGWGVGIGLIREGAKEIFRSWNANLIRDPSSMTENKA